MHRRRPYALRRGKVWRKHGTVVRVVFRRLQLRLRHVLPCGDKRRTHRRLRELSVGHVLHWWDCKRVTVQLQCRHSVPDGRFDQYKLPALPAWILLRVHSHWFPW